MELRERINVESESKNIFYTLPKILFTSEKFSNLKMRDKVTYAILRDRKNLSAKNNWRTQDGEVYILMSRETISGLLNCHRNSVSSYIKRLSEADLLVDKFTGQAFCNQIFVKDLEFNSYYAMPKFLFLLEEFKDLSITAKLLYTILKDKMELSIAFNNVNDKGELYTSLERTEMQKILNLSDKTIKNAMDELKKYDLIDEVFVGLGKPNQIFLKAVNFENLNYQKEFQKNLQEEFKLKDNEFLEREANDHNFTDCEPVEPAEIEPSSRIGEFVQHLEPAETEALSRIGKFVQHSKPAEIEGFSRIGKFVQQGSENLCSQDRKICAARIGEFVQQGSENLCTNKTIPIKTISNNTNSLSHCHSHVLEEEQKDKDRQDEIEKLKLEILELKNELKKAKENCLNNEINKITDLQKFETYKDIIKNNVNYNNIKISYGERTELMNLVDNFITIMSEAMASNKEYIKINKEDISQSLVSKKFELLTEEQLFFAINQFKKYAGTVSIKFPKKYILTCIYNATTEQLPKSYTLD